VPAPRIGTELLYGALPSTRKPVGAVLAPTIDPAPTLDVPQSSPTPLLLPLGPPSSSACELGLSLGVAPSGEEAEDDALRALTEHVVPDPPDEEETCGDETYKSWLSF